MSLWGNENFLEKLNEKGDPLVRLNKVVDFELFRPTLNDIFDVNNKIRSKGGRPPYDLVMMFKLIVLQRYNGLSDDAMEYQLLDRASFRRFLGLDDLIPDAKTIWNFKNKLSQSGRGNELFFAFSELLNQEGMIAHEGQIVDATFVEAPRSRNPKSENDQIKSGQTPEHWSKHKQAQKDTDARWTKKRNETHFGYKDHVSVDLGSKLIKDYQVTPASVYDGNVFGVLLDEDEKVFADSAYQDKDLPSGVNAFICLKGKRNEPLTSDEKMYNRIISKHRVRVEHVFGFIHNSMGGSIVRSIGFKRAQLQVDMTNLVYNLFRYEQISRLDLKTW